MPLTLNGSTVTVNTLDGTAITKETLNGNTAYELVKTSAPNLHSLQHSGVNSRFRVANTENAYVTIYYTFVGTDSRTYSGTVTRNPLESPTTYISVSSSVLGGLATYVTAYAVASGKAPSDTVIAFF